MENPIKMDDLGLGGTPICGNTHVHQSYFWLYKQYTERVTYPMAGWHETDYHVRGCL